MDASPEIVSQSGPSLKHSLSYEYRTNGRFCDDWLNPTYGMDIHGKIQVACPPGDVGFVKMQGGASLNVPLPSSCAFHGSLQTGILRSLSFGGLCGPAVVSDRFFLGGPMQFRGFVPAGVGPRAKTVRAMMRMTMNACEDESNSILIIGRCVGSGRRCAWR